MGVLGFPASGVPLLRPNGDADGGFRRERVSRQILTGVRRRKNRSRLSGVVSVFPVIGHAGIAENKLDQFGETSFGANIVRED